MVAFYAVFVSPTVRVNITYTHVENNNQSGICPTQFGTKTIYSQICVSPYSSIIYIQVSLPNNSTVPYAVRADKTVQFSGDIVKHV